MHTFDVDVNWNGTVVEESIQATSPANAKSAIACYPGGTLRRIVRVS